MPYEIERSGKRYVVKKKHGGKVMGSHATMASAQAQMRAIHANEKPAKKAAKKS